MKKSAKILSKQADSNSTRLMASDDLLVKLLKLVLSDECQCEHCKMVGEKVLELVYTALGVPEDNTVETNACDIANTTGVWPKGAYSRDWIYEKWYNVEKSENPDAKKFIASVRKLLAKSRFKP